MAIEFSNLVDMTTNLTNAPIYTHRSSSLLWLANHESSRTSSKGKITDITSDKELEDILRPDAGFSTEISDRNQIKSSIRSYFKNILLTSLPTPLEQQTVLS